MRHSVEIQKEYSKNENYNASTNMSTVWDDDVSKYVDMKDWVEAWRWLDEPFRFYPIEHDAHLTTAQRLIEKGCMSRKIVMRDIGWGKIATYDESPEGFHPSDIPVYQSPPVCVAGQGEPCPHCFRGGSAINITGLVAYLKTVEVPATDRCVSCNGNAEGSFRKCRVCAGLVPGTFPAMLQDMKSTDPRIVAAMGLLIRSLRTVNQNEKRDLTLEALDLISDIAKE